MPWAAVVKEIETGKVRLITDPENEPAPDLDRMERHVVPCIETDVEILFGVHDFTRECICRPRLEFDHDGYAIVVHEDRKPN